jgi:hypothetical protein
MRVQCQDQHLRVRIDEGELALLLAGGTVAGATAGGGAFRMRYALAVAEAGLPRLDGEAADWRLTLPAAPVRELAARLPSRDGLRFELPGADGGAPLELLFDVDVRDSTRRRYPKD